MKCCSLLLGEVGVLSVSFGDGPKVQMLMRKQSHMTVSMAGREQQPSLEGSAIQSGLGQRGINELRGGPKIGEKVL